MRKYNKNDLKFEKWREALQKDISYIDSHNGKWLYPLEKDSFGYGTIKKLEDSTISQPSISITDKNGFDEGLDEIARVIDDVLDYLKNNRRKAFINVFKDLWIPILIICIVIITYIIMISRGEINTIFQIIIHALL